MPTRALVRLALPRGFVALLICLAAPLSLLPTLCDYWIYSVASPTPFHPLCYSYTHSSLPLSFSLLFFLAGQIFLLLLSILAQSHQTSAYSSFFFFLHPYPTSKKRGGGGNTHTRPYPSYHFVCLILQKRGKTFFSPDFSIFVFVYWFAAWMCMLRS
jgi:hypothetical protein